MNRMSDQQNVLHAILLQYSRGIFGGIWYVTAVYSGACASRPAARTTMASASVL
jgi:hypothetical protein